ncbi:MAG TPA: hypothetical protein VGH19_16330 [Verrucomicrobiae bacterium]
MSLRRINWLLRRPGFGALLAFWLLVAGVLSLNGVHGAHEHHDAHHHHDHHYHAGDAHHHHDSDESQSSEHCAICFYRSASVAFDFFFAPLPPPEFVPVAEIDCPHSVDYAVVIMTLWSGRAPPIASVS